MLGSDKVIFRAGGRDFTSADAVRAAEHRSALNPVRLQTSIGIACRQYADEEGFALDPDEVESAADAYRTEHDLTTADETEGWLEVHELSLDDFSAWLERRIWHRRFLIELPVIERDYRPEPVEVDNCLWPEIVFGDHLAGFKRDFAARVAVRLAANHAGSQPGWADDLTAMERQFLDRCREASATAHADRELAARGTTLMQLDLQLASFAAAGAAREAWLCVAQDGEPLEDVSRRAGADILASRLFLDELPEALRQPAMSVAPGELIAPLEIGGRMVVCRVLAKQDPSMDDPRVRGRIESALVDRAIDDLMQQHIRWA